MIGEVIQPGKTTVKSNSPIKQSILNAGGYKFTADQSKLTLLRLKENGRIEKRILKLKDSKGLDNIFLEDRDVVVVERNKLSKASKTLQAITEPIEPIINARTMYKVLFGE